MQDISFTTENGYDRLNLSSGSFGNNVVVGLNSNEGAPELPMLKLKFLVPVNSSNYNVQLTNTSTHNYTDLYNIYPTQQPAVDLETPVSWVGPDQQIYSSATPYPSSQVIIKNEALTLGYKVITVYVSPFSYIPSSQQLSVLTQFDIGINYSTQQGAVSAVRPHRISYSRNEQVTDMLSSYLINSG